MGKSTLFNRLVGRKMALVDNQAGVTRDRKIAQGKLHELNFTIIDTAGLETTSSQSLQQQMVEQSKLAIQQCDIALFLLDAKSGINFEDKTFAKLLQKSGKPTIAVANKCEGKIEDEHDIYSLGLGEPILISAEHAQGMFELKEAIKKKLKIKTQKIIKQKQEKQQTLNIAIVGRPNSGKSTLINKIIGNERLLTGETAGITRDAIEVEWIEQGKPIRLFDTAGLRRRAKVIDKLEKLSVMDAKRTVQYAELVVFLFDSTIAFEKQDLHIIDEIAKQGRAIVLAFNKWDLIKNKTATKKKLMEQTQKHLPQLKGIGVVMLSGKTGAGLKQLWNVIFAAYDIWNKRITTSHLNQWLGEILQNHPPPLNAGKQIRLKYITQAKARPPTFMVHISRASLPESYVRYLRNSLRDCFDLQGVPIRIKMKKSKNPYNNEKKNAPK